MTLHVLVEGPSERAFLDGWATRLLKGAAVKVHPHQGKGRLPDDVRAPPDPRNRSLLHQLPAKLRAFAAGPDACGIGVLVLVDADDDDCRTLAGAITATARSVAANLRFVARVAVEETEAFYFGDLRALKAAFPDADMILARSYVPDSVCGTWELFGRVVGDGGGNKVAWAEAMAQTMTTDSKRSRSPSFRALCRALERLVQPTTKPPVRTKRYRHVARTVKQGRRK